MVSRIRIGAVALAMTFALSACGAGSPAPDTAPMGEGCGEGPEGTIPMINQDHGYCLRYPEGFEESYPNASESVLIGPVPAAGTRPQVFIEVSEAGDRTAAQIADEIVADAGTMVEIGREDITLDSEPGVRLDGVPGQDFSRVVVVVYEGRAYELMFVPWDESQAEPFAQVENLYTTVVETWEFPGN